jgi:cell division protein FtsN
MALVAIGVCAGVVVGSVWNVPEMLLARLREPVETVDLRARPSAPAGEMLTPFRELQTARPSRPATATPAPRAAASPPAAARTGSGTQVPPEPDASAVSAPPAATPSDTPSPGAAHSVIASIAARRGSERASTPERVVQVAATPDRVAAAALVERLRALGFRSFISGTRPAGRVRYRVRVRPGQGEEVAALAERLQARGFGVWITTE